MLDNKDIKKLRELLKPFATKGDLKSLAAKSDLKFFPTKEDLKEEIDGLATMIVKSFNNTEERMAAGFKQVNEKLDKKVDGLDKRMAVIEDAMVIK